MFTLMYIHNWQKEVLINLISVNELPIILASNFCYQHEKICDIIIPNSKLYGYDLVTNKMKYTNLYILLLLIYNSLFEIGIHSPTRNYAYWYEIASFKLSKIYT